jgi:hypothetical protein
MVHSHPRQPRVRAWDRARALVWAWDYLQDPSRGREMQHQQVGT